MENTDKDMPWNVFRDIIRHDPNDEGFDMRQHILANLSGKTVEEIGDLPSLEYVRQMRDIVGPFLAAHQSLTDSLMKSKQS